MALRVSPVSRNLALKVTFMFLEIEDMLALGFACAVAMIAGQFLFSDRFLFVWPIRGSGRGSPRYSSHKSKSRKLVRREVFETD